MKNYFFALVFVFFSLSAVQAETYKIDDASVEYLFTCASDVSPLFGHASSPFGSFCLSDNPFSVCSNVYPATIKEKSGEENKQLIAGLVALGSYFIGIGWTIPIHRFILGTGGKTAMIFFAYFCTCSGCGIILLVDGILLVIDGKGTKYLNNPKFVMW